MQAPWEVQHPEHVAKQVETFEPPVASPQLASATQSNRPNHSNFIRSPKGFRPTPHEEAHLTERPRPSKGRPFTDFIACSCNSCPTSLERGLSCCNHKAFKLARETKVRNSYLQSPVPGSQVLPPVHPASLTLHLSSHSPEVVLHKEFESQAPPAASQRGVH